MHLDLSCTPEGFVTAAWRPVMMSRWAPVCTFYYSGRFYAALRDDDNTSSLCVTGNTSECNVFTQILHLDKSWWNITSWCRHKLAYTMLKIRNFAKNLQPPAQSWCRNLCCVQNETCCSSSVGERQADKQRERERDQCFIVISSLRLWDCREMKWKGRPWSQTH